MRLGGSEDLASTLMEKPKAYCFNESSSTMIIGFESNLLIKFVLKSKSREVLIAGHSDSPLCIIEHPKMPNVILTLGTDKYIRAFKVTKS